MNKNLYNGYILTRGIKMVYTNPKPCLNQDGDYNCSNLFNCCSCGGNGCGCAYCFDCHACENCLEDD